MKRIIILAVALLAPLGAEAQEKPDSVIVAEFSMNYQNFVRKGEGRPWFYGQGYEYFPLITSCGYWGWLFGEYQYVSGVGGFFCDPAPWISVGAALGGESFVNEGGDNSIFGRWALTAYFGAERTNLEIYFENGPSKTPWYRGDLQLWGNRYFAIGGVAQTDDGVGPRAELRLPLSGRWDLRLNGAPMFRKGEVNSLVELKLVWTLREVE